MSRTPWIVAPQGGLTPNEPVERRYESREAAESGIADMLAAHPDRAYRLRHEDAPTKTLARYVAAPAGEPDGRPSVDAVTHCPLHADQPVTIDGRCDRCELEEIP